MDRVADLLTKVLQRRGLADHAQAALAVHRAQAWLKQHLPHIHSVLRVARLHEGTLEIECGHAIAAQECQAQVPGLLSYLQENGKNLKIHSIRLIRGTQPRGKAK